MTTELVVALVTGVLALLGVVIRQLVAFTSANNSAHQAVSATLSDLGADLHEHRTVTEHKLEHLSGRVESLHDQAEERERYWRKRGETITEKIARLEERTDGKDHTT